VGNCGEYISPTPKGDRCFQGAGQRWSSTPREGFAVLPRQREVLLSEGAAVGRYHRHPDKLPLTLFSTEAPGTIGAQSPGQTLTFNGQAVVQTVAGGFAGRAGAGSSKGTNHQVSARRYAIRRMKKDVVLEGRGKATSDLGHCGWGRGVVRRGLTPTWALGPATWHEKLFGERDAHPSVLLQQPKSQMRSRFEYGRRPGSGHRNSAEAVTAG